jgi:hypothetical protein
VPVAGPRRHQADPGLPWGRDFAWPDALVGDVGDRGRGSGPPAFRMQCDLAQEGANGRYECYERRSAAAVGAVRAMRLQKQGLSPEGCFSEHSSYVKIHG